jgi:hypothetical protein
MANSVSHASLPYPIRKARFTIGIPYVDADGDPTDPGTPDTEFSLDASAMADCAEEATTVSTGFGYITLTGAETDGSLLLIAAKVGSGPKNTLAVLYPKNLAVLTNGTASAGAAGTITLALDTKTPLDLTGCFVRTTGGTGGGGTGGANNQARRIISYAIGTRVATVSPNLETTPDATTTYDILLPEGVVASQLTAGLPAPVAAGTLTTYTDATNITITGHASVRKGGVIYALSSTGVGGLATVFSHNSGSGATVLEDPGFPAALGNAATVYVAYPAPNATAISLDDDDMPNVNVQKVNDVELQGTGVPSSDPWEPA